jgi:hypothetical protein
MTGLGVGVGKAVGKLVMGVTSGAPSEPVSVHPLTAIKMSIPLSVINMARWVMRFIIRIPPRSP